MPQANDAPRYHAPRLMLITRPRSRASQVSATSIDPSTHSPFSAKPTAHRAAKDREGGRQRQQRAAPAAIGQPRPEVTARRCRRSPSLARWRWRWRCAYGSGCDGRRVGDCTVVRAQHMPSLKRTCRNRCDVWRPAAACVQRYNRGAAHRLLPPDDALLLCRRAICWCHPATSARRFASSRPPCRRRPTVVAAGQSAKRWFRSARPRYLGFDAS